jgi:photosystem II stability/assembly factor-like uncharacterized protein
MKIALKVFSIFCVASIITNVQAQWKKVPGVLVKPYVGIFPNNEYGVIHKNGTLWAGWNENSLQFSNDTGKTWESHSFSINNGIITDINFFDKLNGIAATLNNGVLLTENGGFTWKKILSVEQCTNVSFGSSAKIIYAISTGSFPSPTGLFHASTNGGLTWTSTWPGGQFCGCFTIAKDGTIYVLCSKSKLWLAGICFVLNRSW